MDDLLIEANKIEHISDGGDAGSVYEIRCPKCDGPVRVAQGGWWGFAQ